MTHDPKNNSVGKITLFKENMENISLLCTKNMH